jgi:hypothetical protein
VGGLPQLPDAHGPFGFQSAQEEALVRGEIELVVPGTRQAVHRAHQPRDQQPEPIEMRLNHATHASSKDRVSLHRAAMLWKPLGVATLAKVFSSRREIDRLQGLARSTV